MITLVIIGVIAALTIPNLLQKYQEQATVKKVQKFYSNLSNAYNLAMKDSGTVDEWELTSSKQIYEILFKPYFKITKVCGFAGFEGCRKQRLTYKLLSNEDDSLIYNNVVTLNDGATVLIRTSAIYYDINGDKSPNQYGKDMFIFKLQEDKVFPWGIQSGKYSYAKFNQYCTRTSYGTGCAAWVIYKGNMDYLHCDGLTWENHSCKDK